ncbi:MAG: NAD(P)-dependent dehydrogenase (short-subunit alcohol dehydrogenase family) [Pseudohongiellaceae bacterium]|jgi:NAD(P)-dependent dehydrogenase (short-subunit alcohol dehydrogenase family)
MTDLFRIDNQVALVTGAGRGLGRAMAVGLAQAGANVVVVARREADLAETVAAIEATGRKGLAVVGDVAEAAVASMAVAAAVDTFGRIDILINNAGLYQMGPIEQTEDDAWRDVLEVNLMASFRFAKAVGSHFLAQGSGKVVNIASVLGTFGVGEATAYCTAKAGIMGFTRSLAVEWGPKGINVNAIAPGLFDTDMSAGVMGNKGFYDSIVAGIPRGQHGEPDEIVGTAVYLCSAASNHVVGQVIHVDGGATIA